MDVNLKEEIAIQYRDISEPSTCTFTSSPTISPKKKNKTISLGEEANLIQVL